MSQSWDNVTEHYYNSMLFTSKLIRRDDWDYFILFFFTSMFDVTIMG